MASPLDSNDDYALLQRYLKGEARAMDVLVDRHAGRVYGFVLRFTGNAALAEDLTQEVWLRVLRSAVGFEGRARFSTWVFTLARSVCLDHYRKDKRRSARLPSVSEPQLENLEGEEPLPLERLADQELAEHVLAAVSELPDAQREVFLLREEGLSAAEVAEIQGVPRDTVKSRMRYALTYVRRILRARLGEGASRGL